MALHIVESNKKKQLLARSSGKPKIEVIVEILFSIIGNESLLVKFDGRNKPIKQTKQKQERFWPTYWKIL